MEIIGKEKKSREEKTSDKIEEAGKRRLQAGL